MKILPDKKLFLISYLIGAVLNLGDFLQIKHLGNLIGWLFINNLIYAILVMVGLRIAFWVGKKAGLGKKTG